MTPRPRAPWQKLNAVDATRGLRPPVPREKDVEHACDVLMAACGFTAVRFSQARATRQSLGIPDRRYYSPARRMAFWFECKRPGGKQSPHQKAFQAMCESCGEAYVLGRTEELMAYLVGSGVIARRGQSFAALHTPKTPTPLDAA